MENIHNILSGKACYETSQIVFKVCKFKRRLNKKILTGLFFFFLNIENSNFNFCFVLFFSLRFSLFSLLGYTTAINCFCDHSKNSR